MKKFTLFLIIALLPLTARPQKAKADMWGADVAVLAEVLATSIQQLYQIMMILQTTQDTYHMMRDVNKGYDAAVDVAAIILPEAKVQPFRQGKANLENLKYLYEQLKNQPIHHNSKGIAESLHRTTLAVRSGVEAADSLNQLGTAISKRSSSASPKGASKLTAQGVGAMLSAMSQSIANQAQAIALEGQRIAFEQQEVEDQAQEINRTKQQIKTEMAALPLRFDLPKLNE